MEKTWKQSTGLLIPTQCQHWARNHFTCLECEPLSKPTAYGCTLLNPHIPQQKCNCHPSMHRLWVENGSGFWSPRVQTLLPDLGGTEGHISGKSRRKYYETKAQCDPPGQKTATPMKCASLHRALPTDSPRPSLFGTRIRPEDTLTTLGYICWEKSGNKTGVQFSRIKSDAWKKSLFQTCAWRNSPLFVSPTQLGLIISVSNCQFL